MVISRYIRATPTMTSMTSLGWRLASRCEIATSSVKAKPAAIEVFLASAINTEMSGGIAERHACGNTMLSSVCQKFIPTDRAASAWPTPTEFTPERMDSHTKALVYRVSDTIAGQKPSSGNTNPNDGATNTQKKNMRVSGVLRTISTYSVPKVRSGPMGETLNAASTVPSTRDNTPATAVRDKVARKPPQTRPNSSINVSTRAPYAS